MNHSPILMKERIAIGISACCMGAPVRYNAKGWDLLAHLGREKSDFKWCPVCPECMAGLGVTRDPIHIAGESGRDVWVGQAHVKNRAGEDVTEALKEAARVCFDALKRAGAVAYVYMDGSPTCGVYRTTLRKQSRGKPPGIFGSLLLDEGLFLIPSSDLQSPLKWWDWRRRLLAFAWLSNVSIEDASALFDVWHRLKFLCQELNNEKAREMGRRLADVNQTDFERYTQTFLKETLQLLRTPSTTPRMINSLWKNYAYYRKQSGKSIPDVKAPDFRRNVTKIASEMIQMERAAVEDSVLFGTSPVIYRDPRRDVKDPKKKETNHESIT